MTKLKYLIQKTTSFVLSHIFATVKSHVFLLLFFVVYTPTIVYHSYLFVNFILKSVDNHSRLIYEVNVFNSNFRNFNKFLTILNYINSIVSCINSNFYVVDFYSLAQSTRLNFFKALTSEFTSISISPDPLFLCLLFFSMFSYVFFKNGHEKRLKYPLMDFVFIQSYLSSPSLERMCTKVKVCNEIHIFFYQNIYAHLLHLITFASNIHLKLLQSQTLND